jgi:glycosyltransferase involved in cell wall biosynthesis
LPLDIAYISPLPPQRTGIAEYSADLLPYLGRLAQVTAFVSDERCLNAQIQGLQSILPLSEYDSIHRQFDLAIYQMGNNELHVPGYTLLKRRPGLTVMHDYGLHHLMAWMTARLGDFAGYARELGYALGPTGTSMAHAIRLGNQAYPLFQYPLNERVLDHSLGVIAHSQYAAQQIRRQRPDLPVGVIPHLVAFSNSAIDIRQRLDIPPDIFVVGCIGQVTLEKRVDVALRAFAQARWQLPSARFLLVGEVPDWYPIDMDNLVRELDLTESVIRTGRVENWAEFKAYIAAIDVCVNMRFPTVGETSGSVLQAMAAGRPVIVTDVGWYAELPDDACLKIDHSPGEEAILAQHLIDLAADHTRRELVGRRARAYIEAKCGPEQVARAYIDFAQQIIERVCHFARRELYV